MHGQIFCSQSSSSIRTYLPWICTSLAIGYAAYLHYRSRCNRKRIQMNLDKKHARSCEVNIDDIDRNPIESSLKPDNNIEVVRGEINLDDYEEYLIEIDEESDADNDVDQKEENLENLELNDNDDQLEMKPTTCPNDDNNIVKEVKFDDAIVTILPEPETIKERRESFVSQMNAIHESNIEPNSFRQQQQLAQPLIKRKRYSLKGDIDDLAFDIFCFDEMPIIRQEFNSKIHVDDDDDDLNEEILDELLRRWRHLSADLKDEYHSKATLLIISFDFLPFKKDTTEKKISYCRCWKSKTFPLCDGEHKCHNQSDQPTLGGSGAGGGSSSATGSNGSDDFDDQLVKIDSSAAGSSLSSSNNNNTTTTPIRSSNVNVNNNNNLSDEQLSSLEMIDDDNNFTTFNNDKQQQPKQ
ncbi:CDGSH iron-sulfur domain-containing protein 2, variant 3 [Dermatophagoides farinae]|nr:CDGSH iron-sulfur domain-containing protein 2, variant 3 [Dermatophagoides farinae]